VTYLAVTSARGWRLGAPTAASATLAGSLGTPNATSNSSAVEGRARYGSVLRARETFGEQPKNTKSERPKKSPARERIVEARTAPRARPGAQPGAHAGLRIDVFLVVLEDEDVASFSPPEASESPGACPPGLPIVPRILTTTPCFAAMCAAATVTGEGHFSGFILSSAMRCCTFG